MGLELPRALRGRRATKRSPFSDLVHLAEDAAAWVGKAPGGPRAVALLEMAVRLHGAALTQMTSPPADAEPAPTPPLRLVHFNPSITGRGRAARRDTGLSAVDPGDADRSRVGGSAR